MIGWAIVAGQISIEPIILFLIIFFWTPSHFWALSLYKAEDYKKAKIPMMPVIMGIQKTKLNTEAVMIDNIKGTNYKTFYTKFGNIFAQLLFIIVGVLFLKTLFRYEKNI